MLIECLSFRIFQQGTRRVLHVLERVSGLSFLEDVSEFLLAFDDIFEGSKVIDAKVREMVDAAWDEIQDIESRGGAVEAVESGHLKQRLVESNAERLRAIERGDQVVVGVNKYQEGAPSPLTENLEDAILTVDPAVDGCGLDLGIERNTRDIPGKNGSKFAGQAGIRIGSGTVRQKRCLAAVIRVGGRLRSGWRPPYRTRKKPDRRRSESVR